jgi:aconitate hydratase
VLKVVQMLRKKGVVGKFVEFYGAGLDHLPLADRATIANMAPEYGATCGFFPIDAKRCATCATPAATRTRIALVEAYAKENGFWRDAGLRDPVYTDTLSSTWAPSCRRSPARSGRRIMSAADEGGKPSQGLRESRRDLEPETFKARPGRRPPSRDGRRRGLHDRPRRGGDRRDHLLHQHLQPLRDDRRRPGGAQGARAGPDRKPWVKTSLAPGSQVVAAYLEAAGLQEDLDAIGFNLVGYGCTTCIGNSGPLPAGDLQGDQRGRPDRLLGAVGQPQLRGPDQPGRAGQLPRLAAAGGGLCAGRRHEHRPDHRADRQDKDGNDVYLKDIWPSPRRSPSWSRRTVTREAFQSKYADVFKGDEKWQGGRDHRQRDL